jgi:Domain of unknown function (DUF1906)
MSNGISTSQDVTDAAACLAQAGVSFVFRYYSTTTSMPEKVITASEANAILAANLMIGVVYEDGPTSANYFSNARGVQDATAAFNMAISLGQPTGSAIYFAVDYDASDGDISGPILDYFNGVSQGLQNASSSAGGVVAFTIGVYGSGAVCNSIKQQSNIAKYAWLAESQGWNGTATYAGWDVNQAIATSDLCGFTADPQTYDENQAIGDFGGFSSVGPTAT